MALRGYDFGNPVTTAGPRRCQRGLLQLLVAIGTILFANLVMDAFACLIRAFRRTWQAKLSTRAQRCAVKFEVAFDFLGNTLQLTG